MKKSTKNSFAETLLKSASKDFYRDRYIDALLKTQIFEFLLSHLYMYSVKKVQKLVLAGNVGISYKPYEKDIKYWTVRDYFQRLRNFYPEDQYLRFNQTVTGAMEKRNDFIHGCFKDENGEFIKFDEQDYLMEDSTLKILENWEISYIHALVEITKLLTPLLANKVL